MGQESASEDSDILESASTVFLDLESGYFATSPVERETIHGHPKTGAGTMHP